MMKESFSNKGIPYVLPKEISALNDELKGQLFLKTCSRCEHCKKFSHGKCSAMQDTQLYYWLPLNQVSVCSAFDFDETKKFQ